MLLDKLVKKKVINRITSIELVVSEKCQNACKYCYRVRYHNRSNIITVPVNRLRLVLSNTFSMLPDLEKVKDYELFGGDALIDYKYALDLFSFLEDLQIESVMIPTNFRLLYSLPAKDVERLLKRPYKIGISISVDGDIEQRPLSKFGRMMDFPEKMSLNRIKTIAANIGAGFHPMLSFKNSDKWLDQVKLFIDRGIAPYLLEVRHPLSYKDILLAIEQICKIRKFLEQRFKDNLKKFNALTPSRTPRGLGCSALTTFTIMPNGDYPFCHRLVEPSFIFGNAFCKELNKDKAISYFMYDHRNSLHCIPCAYRIFCSAGCNGAQYEYWRGNAWEPIPSVCQYFMGKYYVMTYLFEEDWGRDLGPYTKVAKDQIEEKYGIGYLEDLHKLIDLLGQYTPPPIEETKEDIFVS